MVKLIIWLLVGGALGAGLGYFGQCSSGTCPLTANWKRGAFFGAVFGLMIYFSSGGAVQRNANESFTNVKRVSEGEFQTEVLRAGQPVVVDFYADWCGPCKQLSPMLDRVAGQFNGQIKVVKVNVDQAPALARQYKSRQYLH